MHDYLISNASLVDGAHDRPRGPVHVRVAEGRIKEVSESPLAPGEGEIGTVAPGALADLIVVEGDPLADLSLLTGQGRHLSLIMKDGRLIKNLLN